uniref:Uncharacterized protein n=2 Tax=viral metagenome TaxID=1070528 RepID=A0A6M3KIA2_9ZZZZ
MAGIGKRIKKMTPIEFLERKIELKKQLIEIIMDEIRILQAEIRHLAELESEWKVVK